MCLVIGYGNPLRGDDGVGRCVVEALAAELPEDTVVVVHQLTPEMAEPISRAEFVVFFDAAVGDHPGEVRAFPLAAAYGRPDSHGTTPAGLLALAAALFGRCPPAAMVTITGASFDVSESLSQAVAAAVPEAVATVRELPGSLSAATL